MIEIPDHVKFLVFEKGKLVIGLKDIPKHTNKFPYYESQGNWNDFSDTGDSLGRLYRSFPLDYTKYALRINRLSIGIQIHLIKLCGDRNYTTEEKLTKYLND